MKDHPDRISIDDCHHGWLYSVYSRNLNLGVYREEERGFVGIRHKMGRRYLFTEFHWDRRIRKITRRLFPPRLHAGSEQDQQRGIGHLGLVVAEVFADFRSQLGIAQDDKPPVPDVEAGRSLDGRFEQFFFLGRRHFVVGVEMLDGSAAEDGVFDLHTGWFESVHCTVDGKEDGPNRILLSFQNNQKTVSDFAFPRVPRGPVLSFGIFLRELGYSELDMPLDGKESRPTVAQIADGKPHIIAASYDSFSGMKAIAMDGRVRFSHRFPIAHCFQSGGPKPAMIGGWRKRETFTGGIDELAIYDYALSDEELASHFDFFTSGETLDFRSAE